jgi:hypothetical protein
MNHIRPIVALIAGLTAALLMSAAPAAFAMQVPAPGQLGGHPVKHALVIPAPTHTVVGGMPGWQISLIATGAALLAAVLAVLADRMLAGRRRMTAHG